MKKWYDDGKIGIYFSHTPNVAIRYATPGMSEEEKADITKKPFINKTELKVRLKNYKTGLVHIFTIPRGYTWDGATIPRVFWPLIGSKTDSRFLIPSMIHDVLCENHLYVGNNRYFCDRVFERLLYVSGVPAFNRWLMFHTVDNFQKFCKWGKPLKYEDLNG